VSIPPDSTAYAEQMLDAVPHIDHLVLSKDAQYFTSPSGVKKP